MNKTLTFALVKETKGAVRYYEVDADGNPVQMADAHVGTLYLRKSSLPAGRIPRAITVTINEDPRYA